MQRLLSCPTDTLTELQSLPCVQIEPSTRTAADEDESKPQPKATSRAERIACSIVDRYALFIGSISGIILSVLLLGVWLGLGKLMGYNDSNWWLIIGTYTGLVRSVACHAWCLIWHATQA